MPSTSVGTNALVLMQWHCIGSKGQVVCHCQWHSLPRPQKASSYVIRGWGWHSLRDVSWAIDPLTFLNYATSNSPGLSYWGVEAGEHEGARRNVRFTLLSAWDKICLLDDLTPNKALDTAPFCRSWPLTPRWRKCAKQRPAQKLSHACLCPIQFSHLNTSSG